MNLIILNDTVRILTGMPIWEIMISDCGIHIQCGDRFKKNPKLKPVGEISLWCECNVRIYRDKIGGEIITESLFPQNKNEEQLFRKHFENKIIKDAFIREKDQSLHFLVEPNIIFSAYPWTKESEKCWTIFDRKGKDTNGITVYSDCFEISE